MAVSLFIEGVCSYPESELESEWFGLFPDETLENLSYQTFDLPLPLSRIDGPCTGSRICGPCNGLFYLETYFDSNLPDCGLWNPATKEFKFLPAIPLKSNLPPAVSYWYHVYGFGLDPVTNNYKVVVISHHEGTETWNCYFPSSVFVYTLGTDSWKYLRDLEEGYFLIQNTCYTYLNGIYFWKAAYAGNESRDREMIFSFNMATDELQEIPLSKEILQTRDYEDLPQISTDLSLALYHDSIAMVVVHSVERYLEIWVMNDGDWVKKISSIPLMGIQDSVGYWKNDKLFLEYNTNQLTLVDPSTGEIKCIIQLGSSCDGILIYKESLVSIMGRSKTFDRMWPTTMFV